MAYFQKYFLEFTDEHITVPALWRIDIYDSEGEVPSEPFRLIGAGDIMTTERIADKDDKNKYIIGRQVTISYEYTGDSNEPLPEMFFEAQEKRFKLEVRKNGVIDGVYYIKPDYCQYPDAPPPFDVQLVAIDGFGYAEGIMFDAYDDAGLLLYDKITMYEAIFTRSLALIIEPDLPVRVINSLLPTNRETLTKLLFNTYIHTDIFIDFITGPISVLDVLTAFCKSFYWRMYIENGALWIIRTQDLTNTSFTADEYVDSSTVNEVPIVNMVITGGADPSSFDAMPIDDEPTRIMIPAIKRAPFRADYKAINRLPNFDWRSFLTESFEFWPLSGSIPGLAQIGSGTITDPYRAFLPYNPSDPGNGHMLAILPFGSANTGNRFQFSVRYRVTNVEGTRVRIIIQGANPGAVAYLGSGGSWSQQFSTFIELKRTGLKRNGSVEINSDPIPANIGGFDLGQYDVRVEIYTPNPLNMVDGPDTPGIEIFPIRLGINVSGSIARVVRMDNAANFTQVKDEESFTFLDTNSEWISNGLFTNIAGDFFPVEAWDSDKPGVNVNEMEYHMSRAHIDQYKRSVLMWQGKLYSNDLLFYQLIEFIHIPGKRFVMISDSYNNMTCSHSIKAMEVFEEGSAGVDYLAYDIEQERD